MVDSILDNVSLRSQIRGEISLSINLQTPSQKLETLVTAIKNYLSSIKEVQSQNVFFNDIKGQTFIVQVEFFTLPMPANQFSSIRQQLNFFILHKLEEMEIKLA